MSGGDGFSSQEDAMTALVKGAGAGDWGWCGQALEYLFRDHMGVEELKGFVPSSEQQAKDLLFLFEETGLDEAPPDTVAGGLFADLGKFVKDMNEMDDDLGDMFQEMLDL